MRPVGWLVERLRDRWPDPVDVRVEPDEDTGKEDPVLRLDNGKARARLGWAPRWDIAAGVDATVDWYAGSPREATLAQIASFSSS